MPRPRGTSRISGPVKLAAIVLCCVVFVWLGCFCASVALSFIAAHKLRIRTRCTATCIRAASPRDAATAEDSVQDIASDVFGVSRRALALGFFGLCFLPGGHSTDVYKWLVAQVEGLPRDIRPTRDDFQALKNAAAEVPSDAAGVHVLDLGAGAGGDLKYITYARFNQPIHVTAIEPNVFTWKALRETADTLGFIEDSAAESENMNGIGTLRCLKDIGEVAPNTVSFVLVKESLCSVDNPAKVVQEVFRVLRPGGVFYFVEHVAAERGSLFLQIQSLLRPLQQGFSNGCDPARTTEETIRQSCPWASVQVERYSLPYDLHLAPHIRGFAVKPTS